MDDGSNDACILCRECAARGERTFGALKMGENTSDWIVLHSLGIANHVRQVEERLTLLSLCPTPESS